MTNIMKDINICSDKCNDDDIGLIKLWNYLKKKIKNKKKKISSDDINELKEQNSDNESDKTSHEKNYPRNITRKRNSITSNSSNSSVTSNSSNTTKKSNNSNNSNESKTIYRKRINSMNIVRNDDTDEYDIVLTYQKYIKKNVDKPKKTYSGGTLFDENRIKINNKIL